MMCFLACYTNSFCIFGHRCFLSCTMINKMTFESKVKIKFIHKIRMFSFKCQLIFFSNGEYSDLSQCLLEDKCFGLPVWPWRQSSRSMNVILCGIYCKRGYL